MEERGWSKQAREQFPCQGYPWRMLTRVRWFVYGSAVTLGATVVVVTRARSMRERLDAEGVARVGASFAADTIEFAGKRLQRSAIKVTPVDGTL